jgi:RNase P subunit RPR2
MDGKDHKKMTVKAKDEELPVTVYMCRKCGKIDFKAEQKQTRTNLAPSSSAEQSPTTFHGVS